MKVLKFGGTSVGSVENMKRVKEIVRRYSLEDSLVVVVSALGGVTDLLTKTSLLALKQNKSYKSSFLIIYEKHIDLIQELLPKEEQENAIGYVKKILDGLSTLMEGIFSINELSNRTLDKVLSHGELLSSFIISQYFSSQGLDVRLKDSRELIISNEEYTNAKVDFKVTNNNCLSYFGSLKKHQVVVLPGFIASSKSGNITTLGRGGSDYTSAIISAAINADALEIWTDVSGMFTANPKIVKQARPIERLSYMEALELSHFGAKVLYPPTIHPVLEKKIPMYIKNTFEPESAGSSISQKGDVHSEQPIKGISHIDHVALLTLEGNSMVGVPGVSKKLLEVLSEKNINVILITQASSEHSISLCVSQKDIHQAKSIVDKAFKYDIHSRRINPCIIEEDLAILAVVGDGMRNYQGLGGKMFTTLGRNNVNIRAIAQGSSERNISTVILREDVTKALNVLHEVFFEENIKLLNLFIMGIGNVGQRLINQLHSQAEYLKEHFKLHLRVIALSNSRKMYFDPEGVDLSNWKSLINEGEKSDKNKFLQKCQSLNLRNSIFVDNTASVDISKEYEKYLKNSIAVVTCNKIACSSDIKHYKHLKNLSRKYKVPFLFETNVGAALPIIDTTKNLIASGDEVKEIRAVLSGSLNFIFNHFDDTHKFHDVVRQAREEGYTEPDPMIDLSGVDVARKILILIRESGYNMNIEDIENKSFLPKTIKSTRNIEDFFKSLEEESKHFDVIYQNAKKNGYRLKYVATYKNEKAYVNLEEIPDNHPFYNLEGKDNIVLFYTRRYADQPLLIKGAGAGADITASGIFSDIIRVGNI